MRKTYRFSVALFLAGTILLSVIARGCPIFESNDDRIISEILSGAMTGEPEAHTVYVNYLLTYPLCLLYRVSDWLQWEIPWYGGMLLLFHLLAYSVLLYQMWGRRQKAGELLALTGAVCGWIFADYYILTEIQYTSTAALLALTGYASLLLQGRKGWKVFFLFEFLAFLLRSQAMLMVLPLGGAVYCGVLLMDSGRTLWDRAREAGILGLALAGVFLIGLLGNRIGYGTEWGAYNRFNDARTELFDYYGLPDYEEVQPILDTYGVSLAEYTAFCNYVILDWNMGAECVEELARYMEEKAAGQNSISVLWNRYWDQADSPQHLHLDRLVGILWWAGILWVLLLGRWRLLIPMAGLFAGRMAAWGYLAYRNRFLPRVTIPLFCCEALLLLLLLCLDYFRCAEEGYRCLQRPLALLLGSLFMLGCLDSGKLQYEKNQEEQWQVVYTAGLAEVHDYCRQRPENRYLLDPWSFMYYRGMALDTEIYRKNNDVYAGTWYSNSPPMDRFFDDFFEKGYDNLRLVVSEEGSGEMFYTVVFLAEKTGKKPVQEDGFTVSHGGRYLVWAFE